MVVDFFPSYFTRRVYRGFFFFFALFLMFSFFLNSGENSFLGSLRRLPRGPYSDLSSSSPRSPSREREKGLAGTVWGPGPGGGQCGETDCPLLPGA